MTLQMCSVTCAQVREGRHGCRAEKQSLPRETCQVCHRIILRQWESVAKNLSQPSQLNVKEVDPFANIRVVSLEVDSSNEKEGGQVSSYWII